MSRTNDRHQLSLITPASLLSPPNRIPHLEKQRNTQSSSHWPAVVAWGLKTSPSFTQMASLRWKLLNSPLLLFQKRFGRLPTLLLTTAINVLTGIGLYFAKNVVFIMICIFMHGVVQVGFMLTCFVLGKRNPEKLRLTVHFEGAVMSPRNPQDKITKKYKFIKIPKFLSAPKSELPLLHFCSKYALQCICWLLCITGIKTLQKQLQWRLIERGSFPRTENRAGNLVTLEVPL